jgi:hypothetical protein
LGGRDDPGGPAHIQGLARRPTQHRRQSGGRSPQPRIQPGRPLPVAGGHVLRAPVTAPTSVVIAGVGISPAMAGSGDQHPGEGPITGQPPTRLRGQWSRPPRLATEAAGAVEQAVQLDAHQQLGRTQRPGATGRPPRPAEPTPTAHPRSAGHRDGCLGRQRGGPAAPGRPVGSGRPRVPAAHPPRPGRPRLGPATARVADGGVRPAGRCRRVGDPAQIAHAWRSRGGSNRAAASTSTGSASVVTWVGSWWVPSARTLAWATEICPPIRAWAVPVRGRGTAPGRSGPCGGRRRPPAATAGAARRRWRPLAVLLDPGGQGAGGQRTQGPERHEHPPGSGGVPVGGRLIPTGSEVG